MAIEVRPATDFEDVRTMVGPKRPDASACWCLSHRLPSKENRAKVAPTMAYAGTRRLCERTGFVKVADTGSVLAGFPRVLVRPDLRPRERRAQSASTRRRSAARVRAR